MANMKPNFYYSFNELVAAMPAKDREAFQQEYLTKRLNEDLQAKPLAEREAILEMVRRGQELLDMRSQFNSLQAEAERQGYQAVFSYDQRTKTVRTHLIPLEEKSVLNQKTKSGRPISSSRLTEKYPTIQQAIEVGGFIDRYGQRGINALHLDRAENNSVIITTQQKMLRSVIDKLKTKAGQQAMGTADKKEIERLAKSAQREASSSMNVAGSYVPLSSEAAKSFSGTGSPEQLRNRRNTLHYDSYISKIITENYKDFLSGKDRKLSYARYDVQLQNALGLALNIMSQYRDDPQRAFEIINREPSLKFLTNTAGYKKVADQMMKDARIGLNIGLSSESAASHQEASLLPHSGTTGGFLEPKSSRKQMQVENFFRLNKKKVNLQTLMNRTFKSRVFSAQEVSGLQGKKVKDINNRLYAIADVSYEDLAEVLGDELLGMGLDGIALSDDIIEALHSFETKTGKIAKEDYDNEIKKLQEKYGNKKSPEEIKKEAIKTLLNIEENFDINRIKFAAGKYQVEYNVDRDAKTGSKFLLDTSRGRSAATFLTRAKIEEVLRRAGYSEEDIKHISGIRQADSIKGKHVGGIFNEALELIASQVNETVKDSSGNVVGERLDVKKKNLLAKIIANSPLKDYITWDSKKGVFLTHGDKLSLAEGDEGVRQLDSMLETLNKAYMALTGRDSGLFERKNDGWFKTKNFIGMSAIRQMSETPYGAPGGEVVSVDYRSRGAIDRMIGMVSAQTGESLTELHDYLRKVLDNTEEDAKRFKRVSNDVEQARRKTLETLQDNFKIDAQKDIVFGWGEEYGEYNLEKYLEADEEMKENRTSSGAFRAELYEQSSFAAIQRAKELAEKNGGTVYFDPQMGYQTVYDEKTGKTFGGKFAAISTFEPVPIFDKEGKVIAYTVNENVSSAFTAMARAAKRANEDPSDIYNQYRSNDAFVDYYVQSKKDVTSSDGITFKNTHKKRLAHSDMSKSAAANYARILTLADQIETETDPLKRAELQQDFYILTGAVQKSEEDVRAMLDIGTRQIWDDTAKRYVKIKENQEDKNLILKTIYDQLYGEGSAEKLSDRDIGTEGGREHLLEKSEQRYREELETIQRNLEDVGDSTPIDIEDMYGNVIETKYFADATEKAEYFRSEAKRRYEARNAGISTAVTVGGMGHSAFNDLLVDKIIDAVTIGGDEYKNRLRNAGGNRIEGIFDVLSRFPHSEGLDNKFTEVFVNRGLQKGTSSAGLGIWQQIHGDNDGDKMANFLSLADADALRSGNPQAIIEQMRKVKAKQDEISAVIGVARAKEEAEDSLALKGLTDDEIKKISDREIQRTSAIAARFNKPKIGLLSNQYQAVTEAMSRLGVDEQGVGNDFESQLRASRALITRGIFSSLTQDAISSKKVGDRIAKKYGDGGTANENSAFFSELDTLIGDLTLDETYKDEKSIKALMDRLVNMGILGSDEKGAFTTTINSAIVKQISQYSNGEAILRSLFGDEIGDNFAEFQRKIDKGEVNLKTDQLLQAMLSTNANLMSKGGIGSVIRNRYYDIPGLQNPESNPGASLGVKITSDNKAFTEYNKTLQETTELADQERKTEEKKIGVAGREAAAILGLAEAYEQLHGSLGKVQKVDKEEMLEDLLLSGKWNDDPLGITSALQKQFGVTYDDRGLGRTVSQFLQKGNVVINGQQYSLKDFSADSVKTTDVSQRIWLDESGKEVIDKDLITRLNHLGYDEETYEKLTDTFGALSYGNVAHTVSEITQDLGLKLSDFDKVKTLSDLDKIVNDRIAEIEKIDSSKAQIARDKWTEKRDEKTGYGGGTPFYAKEYAEALRTIGKNEGEIEEAVVKKILIGAHYADIVSRGRTLKTLTEQNVGVPDINTKTLSSIDSISIDDDGNITVTDFKTKSGAVKGNEMAQLARYIYGLQAAATTIATGEYKNVEELMDTNRFAQFGYTKERPMSQELFDFLNIAVSKARESLETDAGRLNFASEEEREKYIENNLSKYIYKKFSGRILQGNEYGGRSTYLDSSILSQDLEGITDPRAREVIEKVFRGGRGQAYQLNDEDQAIWEKYKYLGTGAYDTWGDFKTKKEADQETEEQENERIKEYLRLLNQEYSILLKIAKAKQEAYVTESKTGVVDVNAVARITELEEILNAIREEKEIIEGNGFSEKQSEKIKSEIGVKRANYKYEASQAGYDVDTGNMRFTTKDQIASEQELQGLINKRLALVKQILAVQHTVNTTYGNEKEANEKLLSLLEPQGIKLDEQITQLAKGGNIREEALKQMSEEYKTQYAIIDAQEATKKKGAQSLWQIVSNDIQRATLRITNFGIASRVINEIPRSINQVITSAKQLDNALMNLRIAGELNYENGQDLILTYNKLAKTLSSTTVEVASAGDAWLRQGYTIQDTSKLIEASMKLSKLGQMESASATKALTSAMKGFKLAASDAMSIVDKLTKVDMEAAVSAGDIAEGLSRVSTSAQLAGLDMDQTIGILSTIGEVTQRDLGSVGDSLRTLLSRYGNVKAGVFTQMGLDDNGETSENINDIEKVLGQLGIRIRSSSFEMRNISSVLDELANKWENLDTVSKNAIATAFAGVRQRENFLVMMENWERVKELTDEAADSAGTADEKYEAYTDSLEASIKMLTNAWEEFSQEIKASPLIKNITNFITWIVENVKTIATIIWPLLSMRISGQLTNFMSNTIAPIADFFKNTKTNKLSEFLTTLSGGAQVRGITYDESGTAKLGAVQQTQNEKLIQKATTQITESFNKGNLSEILSNILKTNQESLQLQRQSAGQEVSGEDVVKNITSEAYFAARKAPIMNTDITEEQYLAAKKGLLSDKLIASANMAIERRAGLERSQNMVYNELADLEGSRESDLELVNKFSQFKKLTKPQKAKLEEAKGRLERYKKLMEGQDKLGWQMRASAIAQLKLDEQAQNERTIAEYEAALGSQNNQKIIEDYESQQRLTGMTGWNKFNTSGGNSFQYDRKRKKFYYIEDGKLSDLEVDGALANQASTLRKQAINQTALAGAAAGVTTAILASQQTVRAGNNTLGGKAASAILGKDIGTQTIDDEAAGVAKGITSGLGAAVSQLPPPWGLIGPVVTMLGDLAVDFVTTWIHAEDLARKQRVEEAKEQLEALSGVKTSIDEGAELIAESSFDSANYQKLLDYVESINNFFSEYIDKNGSTDDILQDINKELYGDATEKYLKDISKISSMLLDDNIDTRKETQRALEIALAKEERRETVASQEEDRKTISDVIEDKEVTLSKNVWYKILANWFNAIASGGANSDGIWKNETIHYEGSLEDRLEKAQKDLKERQNSGSYDTFGGFELDSLRDYIKNLKNAIELNKQVNKALVKQDVNIGYLSADIHDLSDSELQDITTEGVINKIAQALEKEGVAVRTLSGAIKSDYLVQIKAMLKADSEMSALFSGDTKTIGELINAESKLNDIIKASSKELKALGYNIDSINYEYLRDLLDAGENDEFKKIAEGIGLTENRLMNLVYAADPDRIQQFAVAWNITTEKAKELAKEIPSLTTAIGLMNASEITEQFSKLSDILSDVADNTKLSAENFDTLLKSYPEFASKFFSGGETGLMAALIGDIDTAENKAIQNSIFNSIKGSSTLFEEFRKGLSDDVIGQVDKKWTNIGDLIENVYDKDGNVKSGFEEIDRALRDFLGTEIELEYESQKASMQQELWLHNTEKQIEALNDQKDALKANNEERQKEIDLIKAREALENAKKEKKRVYRAGIGWTYEADEEAISNAQENLDELDIERQQDALQVQIDSLTAEKEILENLKENKRFAAMEKALNELNASVNGESSAGLIDSIKKANSVIVNPLEKIKDYVASMTEQREGTVEDVGKAYEKLNKAKEALDRAEGTGYLAEKRASENYKEVYNQYRLAYDSALNAGITSAELAKKGYGESDKAYGSYLSTDEGKKYARLAEEGIKYITQAEDGNNGYRKRILYGGIEYNFDSGDDITIRNNKEKYNMFDAIVEEATGAPAKKNAVLYYNGSLYVKRQNNIWAKFKAGEDKYDHHNPMELIGNLGVHAQGTLSAQSGLSLINELGTEGIITPSGTLTALPAKSGIVPADITRNVWQLGEVAPTLIAQLGSLVNQKAFTGTPQSVVNEEGQYIDNLTMNVYPTKDYDMDALLAEARAKVRLTRHNN